MVQSFMQKKPMLSISFFHIARSLQTVGRIIVLPHLRFGSGRLAWSLRCQKDTA
jgi:hypothetical protein